MYLSLLLADLQGNRQNYSALDITNPSIRCDFLGLTTLPGTPGPASCPAVIPPLVPPSPPPPGSSPPPPCDKTDKYSKVKDGIDHAYSTVSDGVKTAADVVTGGINDAATTVGSAVSGFVDAHTRKVLCEPGDAGCGKLARRMAARLPTDRITVLEVKDLLEE